MVWPPLGKKPGLFLSKNQVCPDVRITFNMPKFKFM